MLNAIYEEDFLGFGYGFRPKRGQHNALNALVVRIASGRVNFIFDADVASFSTQSATTGWRYSWSTASAMCALSA